MAMRKLSLTTKHHALGFQTDGWSCGFQSLNIAKLVVAPLVVEHRGSFSDVPLVPMGPGFVDYVLSIVNADRIVWGVEAPGDDVEGVTELPCPPEPPSTQVEGALWAIEESLQATSTPLQGKEASAEQSVESLEARPQPSMATPTEQDTRPKVLIRGEWRKVPDGYPADASGQLAYKIAIILAALVAYNGGTSVGIGRVRTLFLEPDFVSSSGTLDVGHGPVRTLFLSPILCLVPLTPCETMLYRPHTSALVAYNGGTRVGHGPVRTLFFGLILCLVPMTPLEVNHQVKLCYIGRVPTNWWPRRVLCALWTQRPIVKVAMRCRTELGAVHIAHVLQKLHFFQFFKIFL